MGAPLTLVLLTIQLGAAELAARQVATVEDAQEAGGRLVLSLRSEPKHFNPLTANDNATRTVLSLLMSDLLHINRKDLNVQANLATDWSVSDDGKTYTLTLRGDLRFSDGQPATIDDVLFSFQAYLDDSAQAPQKDLLIVEGEPIRVVRVSERRLDFVLTAPYAAGERLFDSFYILPKHILEPYLEHKELSSAWPLLTEPQTVVGLGPFRLKEAVPGERIVLERNPYYWKTDSSGRRLPYLDEIVFLIAPSEENEALRFRSSETHIIERLSPEQFAALENDSQRAMTDLGPGLEYNLMFFNLNEAPSDASATARVRREWFRRDGFRRGITAAIDRAAIVRLVYDNRATPLATHVTPGNPLWFNQRLEPTPQSRNASIAQFVEAGFRLDDAGRLLDENDRPVEFSLLTSAGNRQRELMATLIQEDLRRVGIEVNVVTLEFRAYVDRIFQSRDYDACLLGLASGDADPNTELSLLSSDGGLHVWRFGEVSNRPKWELEIDVLMKSQLTTTDYTKRRGIFDRVQELIHEHQPFISLVGPHILVGADQRLMNFKPGILLPYTLWNAEELYLRPVAPK